MSRIYHIITCAAWLFNMTTPGHVRAQDSDLEWNWSYRGVFVFEGGLLLDFHKAYTYSGLGDNTLTDCSNSNFYCMKSAYMQLSLPRDCEEVVGGAEWTVDGVRTKVLGEFNLPFGVHTLGGMRYILGDPARPEMVFEYDMRRGVTGIFFKPDTDFIQMLENGSLLEVRDPPRGSPRYHAKLITLDAFGPCDPA